MQNNVKINNIYYQHLDASQRVQIFFGGASAGESVFIADRVIYDILNTDRNYLVVRNVSNTLKGSVYNELNKSIKKFCGDRADEFFKVNKSEKTFTNLKRGNSIYLAGLDDVEKLKSIVPEKGVLTDVWMEEATETAEDDFKQLSKRLRGVSDYPKRLTLTFNPILKNHWIYKSFFAGRFDDQKTFYSDDRILILKTIYKDNEFLEQDDIYELENETSKYHHDVYTLGNWGVLGGLIFTNWKIADLSKERKTADNYFNGLDFGYSADPYAFNRMHYDSTRKKLYIFDETHGVGYSNERIAEEIKFFVGRERVTCDSAEPKSIDELIKYKINAVGALKGKDSVNFGIQWLQGLNEIIIDKGCQYTINEFQQYQWAKDKHGGDLDKPVDKNNHHIDNIRYAMESEMGKQEVYFMVV